MTGQCSMLRGWHKGRAVGPRPCCHCPVCPAPRHVGWGSQPCSPQQGAGEGWGGHRPSNPTLPLSLSQFSPTPPNFTIPHLSLASLPQLTSPSLSLSCQHLYLNSPFPLVGVPLSRRWGARRNRVEPYPLLPARRGYPCPRGRDSTPSLTFIIILLSLNHVHL